MAKKKSDLSSDQQNQNIDILDAKKEKLRKFAKMGISKIQLATREKLDLMNLSSSQNIERKRRRFKIKHQQNKKRHANNSELGICLPIHQINEQSDDEGYRSRLRSKTDEEEERNRKEEQLNQQHILSIEQEEQQKKRKQQQSLQKRIRRKKRHRQATNSQENEIESEVFETMFSSCDEIGESVYEQGSRNSQEGGRKGKNRNTINHNPLFGNESIIEVIINEHKRDDLLADMHTLAHGDRNLQQHQQFMGFLKELIIESGETDLIPILRDIQKAEDQLRNSIRTRNTLNDINQSLKFDAKNKILENKIALLNEGHSSETFCACPIDLGFWQETIFLPTKKKSENLNSVFTAKKTGAIAVENIKFSKARTSLFKEKQSFIALNSRIVRVCTEVEQSDLPSRVSSVLF